ncbi:glyoxysomal processing protease, glyoxysomal isoform X2 [Telopea speciosissima]|uniref:glyoxysomal processing protease, glyoxysomal isoform X2 n=1 Tax=Telopea speciosissima TaxID=54955 RepID=UPI001CC44202|nr:glyoxysomal processing protease, glyoxysomal isoform X2 [Telopea speciosissima]
MELPEIVEFARNFAVMVRIQGPDPKGLKMRRHAFHHYQSGMTTLSASGLLLPDSLSDSPILNYVRKSSSTMAIVVTIASIVEPFLSLPHRKNAAQPLPELILGAQIDVMVEPKIKAGSQVDVKAKETSQWLQSQLLALVDVPASSLALQSLIEAPSGSIEHGSWDVGWSLSTSNSGPWASTDALRTKASLQNQMHPEHEPNNHRHMAMSASRLAFLGVPSINSEDLLDIGISPPNKRGDLLLAMGSPFGVLSPLHFFNSISVGSVGNCFPSNSFNSTLLMADIRCLPGMEGGPIFDQHAHLIGILTRPLRQRSGGAEIQLVIPWEAIATARNDLMSNEPQKLMKGIPGKENLQIVGKACSLNNQNARGTFNYVHDHLNSDCSPPMPVEKAMASTVLITIDDGVWASGVLLNRHGLILTNAHLLEPWRFGKTTVQGGRDGVTSKAASIISEKPMSPWHKHIAGPVKLHSLIPKMVKTSDISFVDEHDRYKLDSIYNSPKRIRARVDTMGSWIWCDARVVYVSKGPLDVALLQLESLPDQLSPITPDFARPSPGSKAYVIGHGLFGPRCDIYPSVCAGVVARVVEVQVPFYTNGGSLQKNGSNILPLMLETTAAVHPGGSGGPVLNSDGYMIGLVTSNARHSGGTIIPHLNFSIPCVALEPIFKFSKDMQNSSVLQDLDEPNERISSVWTLMPPLPPSPKPQLPHLPHTPSDSQEESKGSRFAKFIAERHGDVFAKSNQLLKVSKLSNEILRSKF